MHLFIPHGNAVEYVLQSMCSSHLINFATSNGVYVLFPVATMEYRYMNFFAAEDGRSFELYNRHREHGYSLSTLEACLSLDKYSSRYIGDEYTKFLPFGVEGEVESFLQVCFSVGKRGVTIHEHDEM